MSFDLVKNGIVGRLNKLGYSESKEAENFKDASTHEYGNTFILKCLLGEMGAGSETLIDRFYDNQEWHIQIAFKKTSNNEVIVRDDVHRKKDIILKDIDNPTNWRSFVRILKYKSWEVQENADYYVLSIRLYVIDTYTY